MKKVLSVLLCLALMLCGFPSATAEEAEYDAENATYFVFSDDGIAVTEGKYDGYKISGTALTLNAEGTYVVSGTCSDGSVKVKKGTEGVTLVLSGVDLTATTTAPLACNKSSAVTVIAASGTVNTLTDAAYNNDDSYPDNADAENAVIKCKDGSQVTLCGGGTLNLVANGKNGIKAGCTTEAEGEAWLTIRDLTLNITAMVNDGINAEQLLSIESGNLVVNSADDGLHCDRTMNIGTEDSSVGPTITIEQSYEGIEAATLNIYGGDITVHATDDGLNAANSDLTNYDFSLNIFGGDLYVDAQTGDGLDSNGSLTIAGGSVEVYSSARGDNAPLDSDGTLLISGGVVLAVGQRQMAQTPANGSQPYLCFGGGFGGFGGGGGWHGPGGPGGGNQGSSFTIDAGQTVTVTDASGNVLATATALRSANYVLFSAPTLTVGASYTLKCDDASVAAAQCTGAESPAEPTEPPEPPTGEEPPEPPTGEEPPEPPTGEEPPEPPTGEEPPEPPTGEEPPEPVEPPFENPFSDVREGDWYYAYVMTAAEAELINGYRDGTFLPTKALTRAEAATLLYRLSGSPEVDGGASFTDLPNEWYRDAIAWAEQSGVVTGFPDGTFRPDELVTREQFVTMLWRLKGEPEASAEAEGFEDIDCVSGYARTAFAWAVENGIVNGTTSHDKEGTYLAPQDNIKRCEVAKILCVCTDLI